MDHGRAYKKAPPSEAPTCPAEQRTLAGINTYLTSRKLTPLSHLGVERDGWFIKGVIGSWDNPHYSIVQFETTRPDGQTCPYFIKFSKGGLTNRNCMLAVLTDDNQVVMVRQHRAPLLVHQDKSRAWTWELPRESTAIGGMPSIADAKLKSAAGGGEQKPSGIIGRELGPLLLSGTTEIQEVHLLGDFPEDSGMSSVFVDCWLIRLKVLDMEKFKAVRGTRVMQIRSFPLETIRRERKQLGIGDGHTFSGLYLLYEHLGII